MLNELAKRVWLPSVSEAQSGEHKSGEFVRPISHSHAHEEAAMCLNPLALMWLSKLNMERNDGRCRRHSARSPGVRYGMR